MGSTYTVKLKQGAASEGEAGRMEPWIAELVSREGERYELCRFSTRVDARRFKGKIDKAFSAGDEAEAARRELMTTQPMRVVLNLLAANIIMIHELCKTAPLRGALALYHRMRCVLDSNDTVTESAVIAIDDAFATLGWETWEHVDGRPLCEWYNKPESERWVPEEPFPENLDFLSELAHFAAVIMELPDSLQFPIRRKASDLLYVAEELLGRVKNKLRRKYTTTALVDADALIWRLAFFEDSR